MAPPKSRRALIPPDNSVDDPFEGVSYLGSQESRGSRASSSTASSSRNRLFEERMLGFMQRIFTHMEMVGGSLEELVAVQQRQEQQLHRLTVQLQGERGPVPETPSRKTIAGHFIRKRPLADDDELAKFCDELQDADFFASMVSDVNTDFALFIVKQFRAAVTIYLH